MQNSKFKITIQNSKVSDAKNEPPEAAYHTFAFCLLPFAFSKKRGFTIVELLVVVSIIALLASSVFVLLSQARMKGRDATREQNIKTIQTALDSYYTNARSYPVCNPGEFVPNSDNTDCLSVELIPDEAIAAIPRDPLNQDNYRYFYETDVNGIAYDITYYLETDTIPGKPAAGEYHATP